MRINLNGLKWIEQKNVFFFVLGIGLSLGACRSLGLLDIWYQLIVGRWVTETGHVPHHDFFVYAGQGLPQLFGGWGWGWIYYQVLMLGGFSALTVVNALMWTVYFAISVAVLWEMDLLKDRIKPKEMLVMVVVILLVFKTILFRMDFRAEQTLAVAWALCGWGVEHWRKTKQWGRLWCFLAFVVCMETLLHTGSFILMLWVPIVWWLQWRTLLPFKGAWMQWVWSGLAGLAVFVVPCLNPNGWFQVYGHLWLLLCSIAGQGVSLGENLEYLPLWNEHHWHEIPVAIVLNVLTLLGLFFAVLKKEKVLILKWVIVIVFAVLGWWHERGLSLMAVVFLGVALETGLKACASIQWSGLNRKEFAGVSLILLALGPLFLSMKEGVWGVSRPPYAMMAVAEVIQNDFPQGAKIFTQETGAALAFLLNPSHYLVSSAHHQLIRNHDLMTHVEAVAHLKPDWESSLKKFDVDAVFLPLYFSLPERGLFYPVTLELAHSPRWKLRWVSGESGVLFEKLKENEPDLTKKEQRVQVLTYLREFNKVIGAVNHWTKDSLAQELEPVLKEQIKSVEDEELKQH